MKKFFVIIVLFALPLVAYLFFASGVNNFARLPVLTADVYPLEEFETAEGDTLSFEDHITILGFPGREAEDYLTGAYHLAEKIYEPYHEFRDFRFVFVMPQGSEEEVALLKNKLARVTNFEKWNFVTGSEEEIRKLFNSLGSNLSLDENLSTPNVFIMDKDGKLRGREEDEEGGELYGYDSTSLAVVNNKMDDDVKVILAEYRLELKKYKEEQQ